MYDYLICESALPLQDFAKEIENPPEWTEFEFQTTTFKGYDLLESSFIEHPVKYTISEDGQLYKELDLEEGGGIERQDYSGEIKFYGQFLGTEKDFWMEFVALFWKGELKEIDLIKHESKDNAERLKAQNRFKEHIKSVTDRKNKWWFKLHLLYSKAIGLLFGVFRYLLGSLGNLSLRIERWIT